MPSSPRPKGQFFFISLMLIITFLSGIQALFADFSDINLDQPFSRQEDFWFWNTKDQLERSFEEKPCPTLATDFVEIKLMTEKYLAHKGVELNLINTSPICPPSAPGDWVEIEMNMTSTNINLYEKFNLTVANP